MSLVVTAAQKMFVFGYFGLVILFVCACATIATPSEKQSFDLDNETHLAQLFNDFKQEYERTYNPSEQSKRFRIFVENLAEINAMNEQDASASYGINEFTDMTKDEFVSTKTGYVHVHQTISLIPSVVVKAADVPDIEIPKQFDWRDHNVVTSVKDQGKCNASFAFSTVGNIEGIYAIKYKELVNFSTQQVVSCDDFDEHCNGGSPLDTITYLYFNYGLETEKDYPYTSGNGDNGICKYDPNTKKVIINKYTFSMLPDMNEDKVAQYLVATGPISIALAATKSVRPYQSGIISGENCKDGNINHSVLLVGYGEENGVPYWLIKNSWGTANGEKGYFRIQRGVNCLNFKNIQGVSATNVTKMK